MTENERKMIDNLIGNSLTKEQFLKEFTVDILSNPNYIKDLLEVAYNEKEPYDVDYLLYIVFSFNLVTEDYIDLLCSLMNACWHYKHEDIATIFQTFRFPQAVECLYQAALTQYEYLEYDESYGLAVKCIWALGDINTVDSRKKLELLAQSQNPIIKENAIKQLNRNT